jgi:CheY-like chemotaxis protein
MTKILLVEDDKSLREIYGVRLLAEGYDIVSAGDGEEALAMAIKERPQLIVSDVMMPKISGFDMLDILRSTTETKDIKVIMMTALSSEDQRERGESLGADRYLVKSQVGIEDVVRTVHEVLGDAPTASAPAGNVFAQPTTPQPQPSSLNVPQRPSAAAAPQHLPQPPRAPQPAPAMPPAQPAAPQAPPMPQAAPAAPAPSASPAPQTPAPQPAPPAQTSNLPQPTAPFSTNRPANLGDRIIHPIETPASKRDFANLMEQELQNSAPQPAPAMPPAQPAAPQAPPMPQAAPAAPAPSASPAPQPNISFEETPLPPRPASPQPPQQ